MQSFFSSSSPIYGLAVLALGSLVAADYYVDNANNTVEYASSGTQWHTFSLTTRNFTLVLGNRNIMVDSSKCYDKNYAPACSASNHCEITFPFTGSGISVYVLQAGFQGVNASLTIDGSQFVTMTLPPATPPSYQTPNVELFSIQSLRSVDHTAAIKLFGWEDDNTSLYFDYALVNETHVKRLHSSTTLALPPSPSSTTSSADHPSAFQTTQPFTTQLTTTFSTLSTVTSSTYIPGTTSAVPKIESRVNLSVVACSASGGFAVLIAITTAIIFFIKCRSRRLKLEETRKPVPFPTGPPASTHDRIVLSPTRSPMDEKTWMRPIVFNAVVHLSRVESDDELSGFRTPLATGSAGRAPGVEAEPSSSDHEDRVINLRREDGPLSRLAVSDSQPPTAPPPSSAPPGYKSMEDPSQFLL